MLHGRRSRSHQLGAASPDGNQFLNASIHVAQPLLAFETVTQRNGDRTGHGLTGQPRQLTGKPTGLVILDIQAHRRISGRCRHLPSTLRRDTTARNSDPPAQPRRPTRRRSRAPSISDDHAAPHRRRRRSGGRRTGRKCRRAPRPRHEQGLSLRRRGNLPALARLGDRAGSIPAQEGEPRRLVVISYHPRGFGASDEKAARSEDGAAG